MKRISVRIIKLGSLPYKLDFDHVRKWQSNLFQIVDNIDHYELSEESDLPDWAYSDELLARQMPQVGTENLLLAICSFPIEDNYHSRCVDNNRVVFSFFEIADFLERRQIPLENALLRLLYYTSLTYLRLGALDREKVIARKFSHDETRGCIYDFTGIKEDVAHSSASAALCESCYVASKTEQVPIAVLNAIRTELRAIKRPLFYRIMDWIKRHPILAFVLSSVWALALGVASSAIVECLLADTIPPNNSPMQMGEP